MFHDLFLHDAKELQRHPDFGRGHKDTTVFPLLYSYIFRIGGLRLLYWVKNLSESYFQGLANYTITFCGHKILNNFLFLEFEKV